MPNVIARVYRDDEALRALRDEFLRSDYVKLPGVFDPAALEVIANRVRLLRAKATRRSFLMPGIETPRRMSTIGGRRISEEDPLLTSLYTREDVQALVRGVTGAEIHRCQHEHEFMVANFLSNQGDSHGWHLDDPAYALVIITDAPDGEAGGTLEFIPNWASFCRGAWQSSPVDVVSAVAEARRRGLVEVRHHVAGDGYVLKASTALHRVSPIEKKHARRAALNLAYQDVANQTYGTTATALYAEPSVENAATGIGTIRASEPSL